MRAESDADVNGRPSIWKGAIAGLAGGLAGAWAMNQFQKGLAQTAQDLKQGSGLREADTEPSDSGGDDATAKAASALSEKVLHHPLTTREKEAAGTAVHYAFGAAVGALYGAIAEVAPATSTALGLPYGAAVWLGADEIAVPALGLARRPSEVPASTHVTALAAHLVYGLSLDTVRRSVRAMW